jgi:hypothetical protein
MKSTIDSNGKLIKEIPLNYVGGKFWELTDDLKHVLHNGAEIIIPKGFKTDLSSTPKFLWGLLPPYGDFLLSAIVHDWLYVSDYQRKKIGSKRAREFADKEMYLIASELHDNKVDNWLRWKGVRLFGKGVYDRYSAQYSGKSEIE